MTGAAKPWIDPELMPILERQRQNRGIDLTKLPTAEARAQFAVNARVWNRQLPPDVACERAEFDGGSHRIPVHINRAKDCRSDAAIVYCHGGGFTFGSPATHDRLTRLLAKAALVPVVSIEYRLGPEHPFPAGLDDLMASVDAVASVLGVTLPPDRIALAGDSAGANLSLACLIRRRDGGAAPLAGAALFYGGYAPDFTTSTWRRLGDGRFEPPARRARWYWQNYLGRESDTTRSLAAPLRADLHDLPPLYLNAASLDPMLDDTLQLTARLAEAGVSFRFDLFSGVVHGFMQMSAELTAARRAIEQAGLWLAGRLAG